MSGGSWGVLGGLLGWSWWSDPLRAPLPRSLDSLQGRPRGSPPPALPIAAVILSLRDLIGYFEPPPPELRHEQRQGRLRALRARQSLFQQEVRPPGPLPNSGGSGLNGVVGAPGVPALEEPGGIAGSGAASSSSRCDPRDPSPDLGGHRGITKVLGGVPECGSRRWGCPDLGVPRGLSQWSPGPQEMLTLVPVWGSQDAGGWL